ncbi:hypothetical protein BD779DRAFT_1532475 [Infundibulicybe gibba]|nr:hypothetical protein BD779DRAFT_1532475 [Infundibulicybe gibba]
MLPIFGDERRRPINLGGTQSVTTSAGILDGAKARRNERLEQKRKQEKAIRLQAWWRGTREARQVRREMTTMFERDITGITGLRCLVLIGNNNDALRKWSDVVLRSGKDTFLSLSKEQPESWIVLIRQVSLLLLRAVASSPHSEDALSHLQVLNLILSSTGEASSSIIEYLLRRDFYLLIASCITAFSIELKNSPALASIIPLIIAPFSILPKTSTSFGQSVTHLMAQIFTIPLLPNRLPLQSVTQLSSGLPLASLPVLDTRYSKLGGPGLKTYLRLLVLLFNSLPILAFDPPLKQGTTARSEWAAGDSDSDSEQHPILVSAVSDFSAPAPPPLPSLDPRTRKRLEILTSLPHINAILAATKLQAQMQPVLVAYFLALDTVWPTKKERILSAVLIYTGGGLLRELYRGYVRGSPLGGDENAGAVMDPAHASSWPPLLFLADLYTQALLTMGDDEFFGTASSPSAPRNPLSLDELTSFSRQLLNIAFTLYFREDQSGFQEPAVSGDLRCSWGMIREKVTKCLLGIHAREYAIDMQSFVEAAVYALGYFTSTHLTDLYSRFEEQQLALPGLAPRQMSKRQIAYMSPRLGILNNIPFAIPFEVRRYGSLGVTRHSLLNKTRVHVRRGNVSQDGFDKLGDANLKSPIEITFIDQFGQEEAGIDGGGVFKEFFTSLCMEVFDTNRGLWLANQKNELYPNPHGYATERHSLNWYRFIGRILGKAMYEGILVDVAFAGFFLAKWLGKQSFLDDLASLDPELYNDLALNFTVAVEEFGVAKTIDLIPNGSNTPVTRENRLQYIHLISHYRLTKQIRAQSDAFFEGLSELIDPNWLRMFNQQEVQILLGGVNAPIDMDDLRQHTQYGGLYDDNHETIVLFWKVVNAFDHEQRRALLRFVTSCSRPPLLGFKELIPNFSIRDSSADESRLPSSSTCVNLLKLPRYKSERVLREKLLRAINSQAGFDLS